MGVSIVKRTKDTGDPQANALVCALMVGAQLAGRNPATGCVFTTKCAGGNSTLSMRWAGDRHKENVEHPDYAVIKKAAAAFM